MVDYQFYGLEHPGGHHLTSVLLHAATAVLLFLLLRRMTGDLWPSAFVAAVFAIHPLRVESVAWVAERKDVLSGLFFVLTLWAYLAYVRHPFSWARYLTVIAMFALGLTAKPMLVTLPFVLLLLDYWPLGRLPIRSIEKPLAPSRVLPLSRLIIEKVPLLALSAGSCVVTSLAQTAAMARIERLPLPSRVANAVVSYAAYLGEFFFPTDLSVLYPHPGAGLPVWQVAAAMLVLGAISVGVLVCWRRIPSLLVGWLWYLGMLVPVIGIVQVGSHAMADRYTYLPQIGLCIAFTWGIMYFSASWPNRRWALGGASALAIAALMACAWHQTTFWHDPTTLWTHALECNSENWVVHNNLGAYLATHDRVDDAIEHFKMTLKLRPDNLDAHVTLGAVLASIGRLDEAVMHYQAALRTDRNCVQAHFDLGVAWARLGRLDDAMKEYLTALSIDDNCAEAHSNLGAALVNLDQAEEAVPHFQRALELQPSYLDAHFNFGAALVKLGRIDEAMAEYQKALVLATEQNQGALAENLRAKLRQLSNGEAGPR
jgi:tetratricopeptide (TPR) repeat protein